MALLVMALVVVVVATVIVSVVEFVDDAIDYFLWKYSNDDGGEEGDEDTSSDGDVAPSGGGAPSSRQDPNNKGNVELAKLAKAATQGAALGNAIGMANNAIRETADTIKDTVDTVSSYVNRGPNNPLLGDWGDGNRGSAYDNALHHYDKHGTEVGAKDFDDYLRKASAFKNTVTNAGSRITPTLVDGATPDVYRYRYKGKYIDLQYIREQDMVSKLFGLLDGNEGRVIGYKIISYGAE